MGRPKKPEGAKKFLATRVPLPVGEDFEHIAEGEGVTTYELLARVVERYVAEYPARES